MKHNAIVRKTDGEKALVAILRQEACSHCSGRVVCGGGKVMTVTAKNDIGASVGDTVVIESPSESVLGYAALVFLAPVLLAVVLYLAFSQINTAIAIVGGVFGFLLPYSVAFVIDRKKREERMPRITEILQTQDDITSCLDRNE